VFWLEKTQGTALVYPQAQLSIPNPPLVAQHQESLASLGSLTAKGFLRG
jgi:hypothetical protein